MIFCIFKSRLPAEFSAGCSWALVNSEISAPKQKARPAPCKEQNLNLVVFLSLSHSFQELFYHFGVEGVQGPGAIQGDHGHPAFFLIKD